MLQRYFLIIFSFFLWICVVFPPTAYAIIDPQSSPNNKYGIHIIDENDLEDAARLVNSSGGDFGYITIVISFQDRNKEKWSTIFQKMQQLHLIPLIRLATTPIDNYWEVPKEEDAGSWSDFLNDLPWYTKNRYIILFNEPNHALEWGGTIDPGGYTTILRIYAQTLKAKSDDFFILPAGLDASSPNGRGTMDEVTFLNEMVRNDPRIFSFIDGWTSHSYPNPGFSAHPDKRGRGTLTTYLWEKQILSSFGCTKLLPVFITETGWAHNYLGNDTVAQFIKRAGESVWNDPDIVAITPFVLNYQSIPFSHFSWRKLGSDQFYPQFSVYQSLSKVKGEPVLIIPTPTLIPTFTPIPTQSQLTTYNLQLTNLFSFLSSLFIHLARAEPK